MCRNLVDGPRKRQHIDGMVSTVCVSLCKTEPCGLFVMADDAGLSGGGENWSAVVDAGVDLVCLQNRCGKMCDVGYCTPYLVDICGDLSVF